MWTGKRSTTNARQYSIFLRNVCHWKVMRRRVVSNWSRSTCPAALVTIIMTYRLGLAIAHESTGATIISLMMSSTRPFDLILRKSAWAGHHALASCFPADRYYGYQQYSSICKDVKNEQPAEVALSKGASREVTFWWKTLHISCFMLSYSWWWTFFEDCLARLVLELRTRTL